ncbi:hypothetical protein DPMN_044365 [Dreissena polymorpha]|uniref:Uncharacterized protein n=1 Tax=Dreissena polymorpha TaxID=45954 RepID=A0A9D4I0G2_DREPO|nr:hypothetical protein DPMN_044365 [Dreissena polymorpha]
MRPTVPGVLSRIKYKFSDHSITLLCAEERIKEHLEISIEDHIGDLGLPKLLQYWTASNILVVPTLHVSFTSQEGAGSGTIVVERKVNRIAGDSNAHRIKDILPDDIAVKCLPISDENM